MDALTSIKNKLSNLGLYSLNSGDTVTAEIYAYAEGLDILYSLLSELEKECFVSTAESYGLTNRENIFKYSRGALNTDARRKMLISALSISNNSFNKAGIENALLLTGIVATITESPSTNSVTVNCSQIIDDTITQSQIESNVRRFIPPHLSYTVNFN